MTRFISAIAAAFFLGWAGSVSAQSPGSTNVLSYSQDIQPLFEKYCYSCHGNGKKKGDLALDGYADVAAIIADRKRWELVIKNLRSREMPPEDKPQPTMEERERLIHWIEAELFKTDCNNPDPGRVTIRRLNRAEYNNTIRDLIGVQFKPADDFPADDVGYGFDNIGDVLSLPPILLEKYLAAAESILEQALVDGPRLTGPATRFEGEKLPSTAVGDVYGGSARALMREGELHTNWIVTAPGEYYLRARAFGHQAGPEPPKLEFRLNDTAVGVVEVKAIESRPRIYEIKLAVEAGEKKLAAAYINNFVDPKAQSDDRDRNLIIDYIEVVGPLRIEPAPETHRRIFFVNEEGAKLDNARKILERFASRAYRRPVTEAELERLLGLFKLADEDGASFIEAVRTPLKAVLVSPHFLFRGEIQPEPNNPRETHPINEHALASRLSYFLWSSLPDEELFELARKNELRKNLESQVRRMLRDSKAKALVDNFGLQWLQIRGLAEFTPDEEKFPEFDPELKASMWKETELFFEYIVREDQPVLDLLGGNYSFLNGRLAAHYRVEGVNGSEFQKVVFKSKDRGGVLGHASVLAVTSNPTRTSPVKRGKWVLDNLLGSPPPPPPPDVPELKEKELKGTLRQRMEQHRENAMCASCHARMDPIGFGLENFNAIGGWRKLDGQSPVDASGQLVSGESFNGPAELRAILLSSKKTDFLRCLSEKILTYALGRGIEYYDKCAIDEIVLSMEKDNYRFSSLVLGVVKSAPFQLRRGEGDRLASNESKK